MNSAFLRDCVKNWISGLVFWAGFSVSVALFSVAYAAYVSVGPMATASAGTQLSSSEWNKVVSNVTLLDSQLSTATSGIATLSTQVGTLNSQFAGLGSLSSKSAVWSAEIADLSVGTADLAASAVTDAKVAAWIAPSKIAAGWAAVGQVLKWNGSAWAPGTDIDTDTVGGGGITAITSASCTTNESYCSVSCPTGYHRTGCNPSYSSAVTDLLTNGCKFWGSGSSSRTQYVTCAK